MPEDGLRGAAQPRGERLGGQGGLSARAHKFERGGLDLFFGHLRFGTGLKAPGKAFRETRAGAFLTTDRLVSFDSGGYRCDYPIRIDGGNLLHQVGYQERADGMADFSDQASRLGERASEGCVRVDWRTDDEYTINAYWLWTHLPWRTKVLVLP